MKIIRNYISGELRSAESGAWIDSVNPATGEIYSQLPDSDQTDIHLAVAAAKAAFPEWSSLQAEARSNFLLKIADAIEDNLESLAVAESIDNGKPLTAARTLEIPRAAKSFRFFATAILHESSEAHSAGNEMLNYTLRQPIGVVGSISPWNLPLYLLSWKIAPALAAGNCVVAKPSELTPMTAYMLAQLCIDAGLPGGVLNIIQGTGIKAGAPLVEHSDVKVITFTGGTKTGATIARTTASTFKKTSLELGGKNPTIIFADCDYEKALSTSIRAAFANQGEICLCGSRIYIEESIFDRFSADFAKNTKALVVGDPLDDSTDLGALISNDHLEKVLRHVQIAREEGGSVLCGGDRISVEGRCAGGYFMRPTVITNLPTQCTTNQEEIFGPVVTLNPFKTESEVVKYANATKYGLSASVWTSDVHCAHRLAAVLEAGVVWINCWMERDLRTPFGGVKHSGVGREGGWEALRFFTETKNVCLAIS